MTSTRRAVLTAALLTITVGACAGPSTSEWTYNPNASGSLSPGQESPGPAGAPGGVGGSPRASGATGSGQPSGSAGGSGAPSGSGSASGSAQPSAQASGLTSPGPSGSAAAVGIPETCTVVASELYNPRGLAVGPDGSLYIAEAGDAGSTPDFATDPVAAPGASGSPAATGASGSPAAASPAASSAASPAGSAAPVSNHGETGRVSVVGPDGSQRVLVDGLTSYNFLGEVVGPAGVAVGADGIVYVSVGGPGPGTSQFKPAGTADQILKVDSSGAATMLADIGTYEREHNPEQYAVDSDVGGIALGSDGLLYVADSGGNDLYSVDPHNGNLKVVAVIPGLPSVGNTPNPARANTPTVDPVPTSVLADPNGGVFVGLLTGAGLWGTPGSAKVVHVGTDGNVTDAATGLNMVVGVAQTGSDLFASQLSTNFTSTPPEPGTVERAANGQSPATAVGGLPVPYGIAFAPDGSLYVAINADARPGTPPGGQVIKCELSSGSQGSPAPSSGAASSAPASAAPASGSPATPGGSPAAPAGSPATSPATEPSSAASPAAS